MTDLFFKRDLAGQYITDYKKTGPSRFVKLIVDGGLKDLVMHLPSMIANVSRETLQLIVVKSLTQATDYQAFVICRYFARVGDLEMVQLVVNYLVDLDNVYYIHIMTAAIKAKHDNVIEWMVRVIESRQMNKEFLMTQIVNWHLTPLALHLIETKFLDVDELFRMACIGSTVLVAALIPHVGDLHIKLVNALRWQCKTAVAVIIDHADLNQALTYACSLHATNRKYKRIVAHLVRQGAQNCSTCKNTRHHELHKK